MKSSKSEIVYFFLSLLVLAGAGFIYLNYGRTQATAINSTSTVVKTAEADTSVNDSIVKELTEQIDNLAKDPNPDSLEAMRFELQKISSQDDKEKLEAKLAAIQEDLTKIATVEENLIVAETTGIADYLSEAQPVLDSITAETKKKELQERLNHLAATLTPVAPATPVEEIIQYQEVVDYE